ncbi:MAG: serine hydrolase domain-containing protein [Acidimicrobiales bacterium]
MTRSPDWRVRRHIAALVALVALVAACADTETADPTTTTVAPATTSTTSTTEATPTGDRAWPTPDWQSVDPSEVGLEPRAIEEMAAAAEANGSDCLVVTRDGHLVGEWYWNGADESFQRESFSVTKSVTATLVGIAQDQGLLDIDQPVSDFVSEWVGTPSEQVTIRNLLSNDSGRFHSIDSDYSQLALVEEDKTAYAIGLDQQAEPGTTWEYNNAAIQVLDAVLERATGTAVADFATTHLFEPLGMVSTIATDPAGNTLTFMGMQAGCRDLARFGLLQLRDGEWAGEQVVSAEWVAESTVPSQELNPRYGFLWWLLGEQTSGTGQGALGQDVDGDAPPGSFAAIGLGNQFVVVIPEHDVVVARLGSGQGDGSPAFSPATAIEMIEGALTDR